MKRAVFPGCHIPQAIDGPALPLPLNLGESPSSASSYSKRERADEEAEEEKGQEEALWLVLKESEARKMVKALENGHAYEVVAIMKNQPWWPELSAAVRGLKYLRQLSSASS